MIGAVLTLASSLCWAGLDATRKRLTDVVRPVPLVFLLTIGQFPIFGAWILLLPDTRLAPDGYLLPGAGCILLNLIANSAGHRRTPADSRGPSRRLAGRTAFGSLRTRSVCYA